jgi:DNA-binding HxlR family transcriptional regulator
MNDKGAPPRSALDVALDRVGDRWTLLVVEALLEGPRRWTDLAQAVPGIAPNVLADRLRRLERDALLMSRPYSERPVRLAYELTGTGRDLVGAIRLLADWGARRPEGGEAPRHRVCGTPLEARWWCPTCERTSVGEEAAGDVVLI